MRPSLLCGSGVGTNFIFQSGLGYRDIRITIGSVDTLDHRGGSEEARRYQRMIDEGRDPTCMQRGRRGAEPDDLARVRSG